MKRILDHPSFVMGSRQRKRVGGGEGAITVPATIFATILTIKDGLCVVVLQPVGDAENPEYRTCPVFFLY